MKNRTVLLWTGSVLVGLALWPREAHASKDYPTVIEDYWKMGRKPLPVPGTKGCLLCHTNEVGGKGTATQPFGLTLHQKLGVSGASAGSLRRALALVQTGHTNSDKDPVLDYTEIVVDGTNPNDPRSYVQPPPPPPPPEGGQGGEGNGGGASGGGGESPSVIVGSTSPPPFEELPPPFTHGCAVAARSGTSVPTLLALLWMLSARAARRRRRTR
jgi:hypothetical protein